MKEVKGEEEEAERAKPAFYTRRVIHADCTSDVLATRWRYAFTADLLTESMSQVSA